MDMCFLRSGVAALAACILHLGGCASAFFPQEIEHKPPAQPLVCGKPERTDTYTYTTVKGDRFVLVKLRNPGECDLRCEVGVGQAPAVAFTVAPGATRMVRFDAPKPPATVGVVVSCPEGDGRCAADVSFTTEAAVNDENRPRAREEIVLEDARAWRREDDKRCPDAEKIVAYTVENRSKKPMKLVATAQNNGIPGVLPAPCAQFVLECEVAKGGQSRQLPVKDGIGGTGVSARLEVPPGGTATFKVRCEGEENGICIGEYRIVAVQ